MNQIIEPEYAYFLKEKDFDLEVEYWYSGNELFKHSIPKNINALDYRKEYDYCSAPSYLEVIKWLESRNIYVVPKPIIGAKNGYDSFPIIGWSFDILITNKDNTNSYYLEYLLLERFYDEEDILSEEIYNSYTEALFEGIKKAISKC